jgi:membrane-bound lytic murein transglycosylase B
MSNRRRLLRLICAASLPGAVLAWPQAARGQSKKAVSELTDQLRDRLRFGWLGRTDVQEFISDLAHQHGLPRPWLEAQFMPLGIQPRALLLINPPAPDPLAPPPKRSWATYLSRHVDAKQVEQGRQFLETHQATFRQAVQQTGVPATVIAGIIGVETRFGSFTGQFPVLETLTTLAFESPRRSEFFRSELESLLLLGYQGSIDLGRAQGSFAGALGIPQFMPSSWRRFAVSHQPAQPPDLLNSPRDAIVSVANYLKLHGWLSHEPAFARSVLLERADPRPFIAPRLTPMHTVAELEQAGILQREPRLAPSTPASLIDLPEADDTIQYWIAAKNFFVITHYNRSFMYAAAVLTLAERLA